MTLALMHSVCRPCCTAGFGSICDTAVFPVPPAVPSLRGLITTLRHTGGVLTPEPYFVEVDFEYHAEAYPRAVTLPGNPALYDADSHWPFAGFWRADCVIYGDDEAVGPFGTSDFRAVVTIALLPGPAIGGGGNRIGAVYVESFRAVVGGVAEPLGDALARCDAIRDQIFADDNGDWPGGSTHPVVQVTDCASLCFNGTAADPLDFLAALPGGASIRIGESDPFGPWAVSATACVTAKRPDCGETPGDLLVGAAAELALIGPGGLTSIGGGTTDGSGRSCLPVTATGLYQWTVTDADGCEATARFGLVPCQDDGTTIESTAEACCGTACVSVVADEDDAALEGVDVAFYHPDANLDEDGPYGTVATDPAGKACLSLTTEQVLSLPTTGEACDRQILAVASAPELDPVRLYPHCELATVRCGETAETATPAEIRLKLKPEGYTQHPSGLGCCPRGDCHDAGLGSFGLVPVIPNAAVEVDEKDIADVVVGTFHYGGPLTLDSILFDADGSQIYESGCVDSGSGVTSFSTYEDISGPTPFSSARIRVDLCIGGTGADPGRVRVRQFKGAGCAGFVDWDTPANPDDREFEWYLTAKKLCHGDEIAESGTLPSDNDTWDLSIIPP